MSKDYERLTERSESFTYVAMIRLMVRRPARRCGSPDGFSTHFNE
jgi:hypothetical protein